MTQSDSVRSAGTRAAEPSSWRIVAGDIGGTSSRFAAFSAGRNGSLELRNTVWLKTGEVTSFAELMQQLGRTELAWSAADADIVVIGIAGPIQDGVYCKPPLIAWDVDLSHAQRDFGFRRFGLMNDFLAQAFACCTHIGAGAREVLAGSPAKHGAIGVVGAGTGLGKAVLLPNPAPDGTVHYLGGPSEGGHTAFAPENERELAFAAFLCDRIGGDYATWNDIVSGRGIALIHEFLTGEKLSPADAARSFDRESETLEWTVRFYARVCRGWALEVLATAGIYVAGGVAAKNPLLLTHPLFTETFRSSRVHHELLVRVPVRLIDNQESGLWGAAQYGLMDLMRY